MGGSGHSQSHVCPLPSPQRDKEVLWVMRGAGEDKPGLFIVFYPMKKEMFYFHEERNPGWERREWEI